MSSSLTLPFSAPGLPWVQPGLRWGLQPRRSEADAPWHAPWLRRWRLGWRARTLPLASVQAIRAQQRRWQAGLCAGSEPAEDGAAARPCEAVQGGAPSGPSKDELLGRVAAVAQRTLGRDAFDTQLLCARALLDDQLVEMATGEGKTLAVALAAAAAALTGTPVHVMTANDYLAQRDAQVHQPLWEALGLRVGVIQADSSPEQRRIAYAADITYATAREIAFDSLRDGLALRAAAAASGGSRSELSQRAAALMGPGAALPAPLLRGHCCAFIDEADSLLIDEAVMPLVLAEAQDDAPRRAACFQALALARQLQPGPDALIEMANASVHWTPTGLQRLDTLAAPLGGAWLNRRHRQDLVAQALVALHAVQPGRDYLIQDGRIELLDRITGRRAAGRVWSRALQTLVELKEGCKPSPATHTAAQTSFQRFFARYHRLAGTSGTLRECRAELAEIIGRPVVRVPLRQPCRRRLDAPRAFAGTAQREAAVPARCRELLAQGRPVLIGVASVTAAQSLSVVLQAAGLAHQVLDARHEAQEALIVARAGQAGVITVATALAGRGTDIELGPRVAAQGGLHVLNLMDSACARSERQLIGRAACQGDPGSAETWHAADAPRWAQGPWPCPGENASSNTLQAASRLQQIRHGWQMRRQRRRLLEQDLQWERRLALRLQHA